MKIRAFSIVLLWSVAGCFSVARAQDAKTFSPPDRGFFAEGRHVYERHCVVCHGERGDGQGEMAATMTIKPRSFRAAQFKYRSTPWGKLPTTEDIMRTIRDGRTGTAMGMFTNLSEREVRSVAEYVKSFSRKWRHAENHAAPLEIPPEPAWLRDPSEVPLRAEEGRKHFLANCASCHGEKGDGNGVAAAALVDALGQAVRPADLREPHLRSGSELRDIYRVLATGLNGTPMVSFAGVLEPERMWEVVAFIETLREARRKEER